MNPNPPLVLKNDPQVGLFIVEENLRAEEIQDGLDDQGFGFDPNPPNAMHLAEDGKSVLVFGSRHPDEVSEAFAGIGMKLECDCSVVRPEDCYVAPVDQLLRLGPLDEKKPEDYATLGISTEDIPDLIQMATDRVLLDSGDDAAAAAPTHAWRALGQLRSGQAVGLLVQLLDDAENCWEDWITEDLPAALAEYGAEAIPELTRYLADPTHGDYARAAAAGVLRTIATTKPELRGDCVARLVTQLENFEHQSTELNAWLIGPLMDLEAVEAMPVIAKSFEAGRVEESMHGDVEDVEIELGLKTKRERPRKPNKLSIMGEKFRAQWAAAGLALPEDIPDFEESDTDLDFEDEPVVSLPYIAPPKTGRNDPCPCGSGKKFKKCCGK